MELTIFKRLTIGYVAIMFVVLVLGVYVTLKLNQLNRITMDVMAVESTGIRLSEDLAAALLTQRGFEKKYFVSKDPDFSAQFWKVQEGFSGDLDKLATLMNTEEKKARFDQVQSQYERYVSLLREEFDYTVEGREYPQEQFQDEKEALVSRINNELQSIVRIARIERDNRLESSGQITSRVARTTAITAAMVIVMGVLVSFFNTRAINRPIRLLREKTKEISRGKFEEVPAIASPPEIKELVNAFNLMSDRLRELDEMKADFISHVSHELRTPLTAVREASSMLLEGGFSDSPEKQQALLKIIKEECERLIRSVNRILDLSSMEAKMAEYFVEECDIGLLIREAVSKFGPQGLRNEILLEVNLPSQLPLVKVDENRVLQVLENLVGNAFKFTAKGGKIGISAASSKNPKGFVEVAVSDTGCGIPEGDMQKIFEKFKRIDAGRGNAGGTGLGLSIAKHIVAAHGGEIWAKSEPGRGSTFYFSVPAA